MYNALAFLVCSCEDQTTDSEKSGGGTLLLRNSGLLLVSINLSQDSEL